MSFLVFVLVLAFGTLFVGVSIQIRHMALELKAPWGHVPNILARKLSDAAYEWACGVIGWSLVILGALTYNTATVKPAEKVDLLYEIIQHQGRNAKQQNVTIERAPVKPE